MDNLTRSQFILLTFFIVIVTATVTGIVTATLVTQAPSPITQTANRVIEKIAPNEENKNNQIAELNQQFVTQEDLVVKIVSDLSSAVVSVIASKDLPVIEQYYVNPFEEDEFFRDFFGGLAPELQVPQYRQKGTEKKQVGSGTGFFISKEGLLLTNKHVVLDKEAEYTVVLNNGKTYPVTVLARDPIQDIAILEIKAEDGEEFNFIPLGNSGGIKVGQTVVAIGNTLGEFQNTVSVGIISGLDRSIVATDSTGASELLQTVIQTDAAINPGNSGGPLLNLNGEVIGINTAIAQDAENVGFSLPIDLAKKGIKDVGEFGEIRYAYLGIRYTMINLALKDQENLTVDYGVILKGTTAGESAIMPNSPAAKAGLKQNDIILEYNGTKVDQQNTPSELINKSRVGETVNLKILREGEEIEIKVTLDQRPETL